MTDDRQWRLWPEYQFRGPSSAAGFENSVLLSLSGFMNFPMGVKLIGLGCTEVLLCGVQEQSRSRETKVEVSINSKGIFIHLVSFKQQENTM